MKRFLLICLSILYLSQLSAQNHRLIGLKGSRVCEGDSILAYSLSGDSLNWSISNGIDVTAPSIYIKLDSSGYIHARERISESDKKECVVNGGMQDGFSDFYTNINQYSFQPIRGKMIYDPSFDYGRYQNTGTYYPSDTSIYWLNQIGWGDTLWAQEVQVQPGFIYDFSFWLYRFYFNGLGYFSVYINGEPIIKQIRGAGGRSGYYIYEAEWFSKNDSIARIEFVSEGNLCYFCLGCPCGGAFGLDDISLKMNRDSLFLEGIRDSAWIEVKQKPFFNSDFWIEDSLNCENSGFELSLSYTLNEILWHDGTKSPTKIVLEQGWQSFMASNRDGCLIRDSIWIGINPFNKARIFRVGDSLFSSHPGYSHQWTFNDTMPLGNSEKIAIMKSGNYQLKLTDNFGCEESVASNFLLNTTGFETGNQLEFIIYPNPSNGSVFIQTPQEMEVQKIELFGPDGREIPLDWKSVEGIVELDLNWLSDGIYHIRIFTPDAYTSKQLQIIH